MSANGDEVGTAIFAYPSGQAGILLDPKDTNLARQNPADWILGIETAVPRPWPRRRRRSRPSIPPPSSASASTRPARPLSPSTAPASRSPSSKEFKKNPNAHAWLWKDHTGHAEAAEITALAAAEHPEYLAKCGGTYSSEWFWSKILHCLRTDPEGLRPPTPGSSAPTTSPASSPGSPIR